MTYPQKMNLFSSEFYRLACDLSDHPDKPLTVVCKNHKAAMRLRLQFYAFRNAARKESEGELPHFPRIDDIEVTIPKLAGGAEGNVVHFHSKDHNELSQVLKAALDQREQDTTQP